MTSLEGIQFMINPAGEKTAVLIDLEMYGEIWEDFYDLLIAQMREDEPRETLDILPLDEQFFAEAQICWPTKQHQIGD